MKKRDGETETARMTSPITDPVMDAEDKLECLYLQRHFQLALYTVLSHSQQGVGDVTVDSIAQCSTRSMVTSLLCRGSAPPDQTHLDGKGSAHLAKDERDGAAAVCTALRTVAWQYRGAVPHATTASHTETIGDTQKRKPHTPSHIDREERSEHPSTLTPELVRLTASNLYALTVLAEHRPLAPPSVLACLMHCAAVVCERSGALLAQCAEVRESGRFATASEGCVSCRKARCGTVRSQEQYHVETNSDVPLHASPLTMSTPDTSCATSPPSVKCKAPAEYNVDEGNGRRTWRDDDLMGTTVRDVAQLEAHLLSTLAEEGGALLVSLLELAEDVVMTMMIEREKTLPGRRESANQPHSSCYSCSPEATVADVVLIGIRHLIRRLRPFVLPSSARHTAHVSSPLPPPPLRDCSTERDSASSTAVIATTTQAEDKDDDAADDDDVALRKEAATRIDPRLLQWAAKCLARTDDMHLVKCAGYHRERGPSLLSSHSTLQGVTSLLRSLALTVVTASAPETDGCVHAAGDAVCVRAL